MAKVTIYNDDPAGRAIRVVKLNPFSDSDAKGEILEADSGCHQFHVRNGELLIITTAEKDEACKPPSEEKS